MLEYFLLSLLGAHFIPWEGLLHWKERKSPLRIEPFPIWCLSRLCWAPFPVSRPEPGPFGGVQCPCRHQHSNIPAGLGCCGSQLLSKLILVLPCCVGAIQAPETRSCEGKVALRPTPGLPQGTQGSSAIGVTNKGIGVTYRQRWSAGSKHLSKGLGGNWVLSASSGGAERLRGWAELGHHDRGKNEKATWAHPIAEELKCDRNVQTV